MVGFLLAMCVGLANAQQFGPVQIIPITKVREHYNNPAEDGSGKSCGVRLFGEFPVYKNYTNHNSYTLFTPELQRNPHGEFSSVAPPPGGTLRFYCYFNGISTPFNDSPCPSTIGESLPDWHAEIRPRGPLAAFTAQADPTLPGRFDFRSTSTEPEGDPITEFWEFGDGETSSSTSVNHRYTLPGTFRAYLTVTDTDGLTNRNTRTITVPAPRLESSLRMPDNPSGDTRVPLGENFKVRLRVRATDDGVGVLNNVRFATNAVLRFPEWLTVVDQPDSTELGTLQPGEAREFDFVFRATGIGKFTIVSSTLAAVDAAGQNLTGREALLNGSVPGLLVEVVFPEEPIRLTRKEPVEGAGLSEHPGYVPQGFPVTLRVSVPAYGPPVRDVKLNNAEANDGGLDIDRVKRTAHAEVPWVQAVPQPVPFPLTVTNKASPSMIPGLLTSSSKPIEFTVMVETDTPGDFSFTGIVSAKREDGTGEVTEVGSDVLSIGGDVLLALQVELVHPLELPRITEGEAVEVWGKVKNMTWDDRIALHPIQLISEGQGLVLGPVPYDDEVPPLGIPGIFNPVLKPREEQNFRARVKTEVVPGLDTRLLGRTNVLVDFALGGILLKENGEERDLKPEDILVEWGKGKHRPGGGITLLRARVDPDPQDMPNLSVEDFFYLAAGKAMENIALGGKDFVMVSIPQTLGSLIPGTLALLDLGFDGTVETIKAPYNAVRYLWAWADWALDVHLGLSAESNLREYQAIADELYAYYSDKFDSAEQVRQMVNRGIEGYFAKVLDYKDRAYEASSHGFNEELATIVGEPFRAGTRLALEEIVAAAAVQAYVARAARSRAMLQEAAEAQARLAARAERQVAEATTDVARGGITRDPRLVEATPGMKALPGGAKANPQQAADGWAVDKVSDRNLRRMTDVKNGGLAIIVAVRSRAKETLEWMKTPLGIVPKPVSFKPKNVDELDEAFLGYRRGVGYGDANGVGAGDLGATALAEPFSREEVLARLDLFNADARTRTKALERHNQRWKEWYGADWPDQNLAKSKIEELKSKTPVVEVVDGRVIRKGTLEVPRRGTTPDSSINVDTAGPVIMDQRRFEMRQVKNPPGNAEFPEGREYYECWLEDDQGTMRRIAGDIDIVAVTDANGSTLPVAHPFTETVAQNLQHGVQAQHPWSSSLRPVDMRKEFLDAHRWHPDPELRGEPLLLYVNGEARVGWFHPTRAISATDPIEGFMWLDGGTGDVADVVRFQQGLPPGAIEDVADAVVPSFTPMNSNVRAAMIGSDNQRGTTLMATCAIRTARTGGAIYRMGQTQVLEKREPDGTWQAADPALECSGGELVIVPDTALREDVVAGTLRLPIIEELLGFDWRDMFRIGDEILIDPGSPTEEVRTVVDHGSLILDRPLAHFHPEGTPIVLYRAREEADQAPPVPPPFRSAPLVWLRADAGLSLINGTNVVSWTDQSRNGFVFTAPTDATRPVWVANSTSGVPAVRFAAASTPRLQGNLGRTLTNATVFTLARWVDTSSGGRYIYAFGTRNYSGLMMTLARRSSDQAYHYDGAAERFADDAIPGTGLRVFTQVYGEGGADRHRLAVNLQTVLDTRTTVGRAYSAVATNVVLGNYVTGAYGFVGDLVEWLVYDRVLSAEERFEVEEYLRQRAGLSPFVTPGSLDLSSTEILHYDVMPAPEAAWALDAADRQLIQTGAGDPSLALSGFAEDGQVIRAKLRASAGSGAMGVVFGYQHRGSFHLFDWRQTASNDADWGTAPAGMRLRSFHLPVGLEPTGADFWSGLDPTRVTTWRTSTLPWVAGREYDVVIRLGADQTVVEVNFGASNLETWSVPELKGISGQFGYHANFLSEARFGPVVLPGAAPVITGIELGEDGHGTVHWMNGLPPFVLESTSDLSSGAWYPVAPATPNYSHTLPASEPTQLFRVRSAGVVPEGEEGEGNGRSQTFGNNGNLWLVQSAGPTRIEAENFDEGGEGVAYHDTTSQNQGGAYRAEAVDIGATSDFGGGHAVGNVAGGEWLEYTIRVEQAGAYRLRARTARGQSGARSVRFLFNGVNKTGNLVVPATGNWASYATVESEAFELAAGTQILRADMLSGGFDLNWIEIVPVVPVVQTTFGNNGHPWFIGSTTATRIEAENFDQGGQGVAYQETTPQNAGGTYRAEAVDVYATSDLDGGHTVSGDAAGEWLEYTIQVEQAGAYRLRARTARGQSGTRSVRFSFDGVDKTGNLVVPGTGNWESYTTVESGRFELAAGEQILRVDVTSAGFNLNWIEIVPVVPVAQTTFGNNGHPWSVGPTAVTRLEAENFDQGGPDLAYLDTDSINQGGAYRSEDVDIQPTTDTGGGFNVGWIEAGEWLEYTIEVAAAGTYQLRFRTARAPAGSSTLRVLVGGVDKTGNVRIPRTVGSQTWTTVTTTGVSLEAGIQTLRVETVVGGFNLNWIEIAP